MDQNTILTGLRHALTKGDGSLDDLDKLLDKVKADIAQAKKEEQEAAEKARKEAEQAKLKRGEEIAALATRLLDGEPTADDVATMLNAYFNHEGIETKINGENIKNAFSATNELDKQVEEFCDALGELFNTIAEASKHYQSENNTKSCKCKKSAPKAKADDDIIDQFLHDIGLR